ncbi:hypothetical protein BN7_4541 [Wickerhamomyces ciferrii]|uniref:Mso1 N-terminal domain-containing protein n=1 Tax=Wickerhamomyces ciferrii (strain ATCC 14091 / BCRC 22168 / CBS 111 / JCM 3599 / NBRC 0793 / NRRL Y-1031 F-60-10) TaxID=1206466 RepID=K0KUY0_WICCF|nr:uncharacterized protein BN7_4541 [Wickerhamomyces ciferrii]CCH44963.1 hypothetical protein BN7_4541 [Wickerhamomyces ciferrii]
MAHLQEKGTFWGKVRSSTNKISSSLANLSIRSEHDGDSVNSTLIHTALVNHYIKKNEQFPSWLGEEQHEPQQRQQQQQQQQQQSSQQSSVQEQIRQPVHTQRFQPQQSHQQAGTSRFASRFQQEQQQQQQRQTNQSPQLSSRFGSSVDSSSAGSRFSGNSGNGHGLPGGGPQRTDSSSGNAMKDRLKRNNYRSNFNV